MVCKLNRNINLEDETEKKLSANQMSSTRQGYSFNG